MNNSYQDFFKKAKQNSKAIPQRVATHAKVKLPSSTKTNIKKNKSSAKMLICTGVVFLITLGAFYYVDDLDKLIAKVEISFFSTARAAEAEAKPTTNNATTAPNKVEPSVKTETDAAVKVEQKDYSEAELNHFARLGERKNELDLREKEIQKMEVELTKQKEELEKKMIELEEMRKKISSVLEEKVQVDDKRIENLVQFYSSMKPLQAAKIIENIDESLAVEVLARMKKKSAADIMNLLKAEKAQVISEKYVGYRK
jgi:flagellar motility protein MotE (MotC chaperone)